jgi:hypothetical protein
MWNFVQLYQSPLLQRFAFFQDGCPIPYQEVLQNWQKNESCRSFFLDFLANATFSAYRWESPPISRATADRPFEFVLLNAPALDRAPDPYAFAEQFDAAPSDAQVIAFSNLGKDATLFVPRPTGNDSDYVHLASFIRNASFAHKHELLRVIAATVEAQLGHKPLWLSTAGMGVAWLHVRLDSQPKYYGFAEYRDRP